MSPHGLLFENLDNVADATIAITDLLKLGPLLVQGALKKRYDTSLNVDLPYETLQIWGLRTFHKVRITLFLASLHLLNQTCQLPLRLHELITH
jgi:hypothetical protein